MAVIYQERPSESPFVQTIWQTQATQDGCNVVVADSSWDMLLFQREGKMQLSVWGAMTKATPIAHDEGSECLGIRFKLGTVMPHLSTNNLLDAGIALPEAASHSFWLSGSTWEFPTYENVDTFVARLVREGLIVRDPVVDAVLQGQTETVPLRSLQRHFVQTTGLTYKAIQQIERAQQAAALLGRGLSILDTSDQLGYFDQAHMTNSLKRFVGQTPAQILHANP
jgi:hypothetical protein